MIDDIDLKILNILQEKARIPNVEVARQVGMAPSAVLERIRKLEKQGVIDGYEVRLNPQRFGRNLVVFLWVYPAAGFDDAAIGAQLSALSGVQEVHFVTGDDGFLVKLRVPAPEALGRFLREQVALIPGIRATRTAIVLSSYKETAQIPIELEASSRHPAGIDPRRSHDPD